MGVRVGGGVYSQYTIGNRAREIKSRLWWVFIFLNFYVGYSSANRLVIALLFIFFFSSFLFYRKKKKEREKKEEKKVPVYFEGHWQ